MSAIDWSEISQALGFAGPKEMWRDFYIKREMSIGQLAKRFAVSPNVVRDALIKWEVVPRGRGGANNVKILDLVRLQKDVDTRGITSVARELDVDPTTLYKRLYYKRGLKKQPPKPVEAETATPDPVQEPDPDENR